MTPLMLTVAALLVGQCQPGQACYLPQPSYSGFASPAVYEWTVPAQPAPAPRKYQWLHGIQADGSRVKVWGWMENGKIVWHPHEQPTIEADRPTPAKPEVEVAPRNTQENAGENKVASPPEPIGAVQGGPASPVAANYGIVLDKTFRKDRAHYAANGALGKMFIQAVVADDQAKLDQLPDDASKLRVTVIGSESETKPIVSAFVDGKLATYKDAFLVKAYKPDHPHIAGLGYTDGGKPDVLVQKPTGEVVHHQKDGDLDRLSSALRKAAPDRDVKQDPGLMSNLCPFGFRKDHWGSLVLIGVVSALIVFASHARNQARHAAG